MFNSPLCEDAAPEFFGRLVLEDLYPCYVRSWRKHAMLGEDIWYTKHSPVGDEPISLPSHSLEKCFELARVLHRL